MQKKLNGVMILLCFGFFAVGIVTCPLNAAEPDDTPTEPGTVARPVTVSAEEWGSTPQPIPEERRHVPEFVTIHHAGVLWKAGDEGAAKLRGLQAFGQREKGWPDLPYHYLITPDGTIYEGRPIEYEPETNTSYDVTGHLGVQLYGNFEEQRVSPAQMESLVRLTAWLLEEFNIDPETIGGHNDRPGVVTVCPGRDLARYLDDGSLMSWVESVRWGNELNIELGAPLEGGPTEMIPDAE